MNNEAIKIIDLESLQREKLRLKMHCSYQEKALKDKVYSIKHNYKQLIGEELLPYSSDKNKKISGILDNVNAFVFEKFLGFDLDGKNKLSGSLIKIAQVGILRLFNRFVK